MIEPLFVPPAPRLAVDVVGVGELVLCLHGVGGTRTNWHANLPAFAAAGFRAAAFDARGYGASDDDEGPLHIDDFRADVLRVLDHLGAQKAHLVGLSMGGRTVAHVAAAHPERVASAVFCDTHLGFAAMPEQARRAFIALRRDPLLSGRTMADIAPEIARTLIADPSNSAAFDVAVASMASLRAPSYLKAIEATVAQDHAEHFGDVRAPSLVVVGAHDRVTPPKVAHAIAARLSGAEVITLADAGHLSNVEAPDAFNAAVTSFLLRHSLAGGTH